jgi:poly(A) polymerase
MLRRIRNLLTRIPKAPRAREAPAAEEPALRVPPADAAPPVVGTSAPVPIRHGPRVIHRPIDPTELDPDAVRILERLTRFNHTAYLVGGCVRDLLLARRPKDFDIGTSATPRQVKRLFSNCRIIGRRFRLAHVYFQSGKIIEVATFRAYDGDEREGADEPGRKDLLIREDNVFGTAEEDALRRDFTINALLYDVGSRNVLDHADGLSDLRRRLVRTIGDPEVRFREDPIRILRAIKFAARLDFQIEEATLEALRRTRVEIPRAAPPRVLEEINRFCRGGAARRSFELTLDTGVFDVILPELAGGYRRDPGARDLMVALTDAIDARLAKRQEASTGEILAVLALPLLAERLGWTRDGTASPPRGVNFREVTDALLRPLAVRLRVSRRDQERYRQILHLLGRMVPVRGLRRGARQAALHRPAFADALWILEAVSAKLGGDFREAVAFWHTGAEVSPAEPARATHSEQEAGPEELAEEGAPGARRRRRRRRSRRRRKDAPAGPVPESAAPPAIAAPKPQRVHAERPASRTNLPSPWDDDYFFAALPTAPKLDDEAGDTDRYGAATVARGLEAPPAAAGVTEAPTASAAGAPGRKRRRRRRPRRGKPPGGGPDAPPVSGETT